VWAGFLFVIFNSVFGPSESSIRAIKANKVEMERKAMDVQYWKSVEAKRNKNWHRMVEIVKPLATKGHTKSQAMLGELYLQGVGVEESKYKGLKWLHSAARNGNAKAQGHMGFAYHKGVQFVSVGGTEQGWMYKPNLKEAIMWYERSIANGNKAVKEDLEKAVKMERKEKEIEDCFKRERYTKEGHPKQGEELRHAEANS
jgi:TPR repeat protein